MISTLDHEYAVMLIQEVVLFGVACQKACERLEIIERTFYHWKRRKSVTGSYEDGCSTVNHSEPLNKIPEEIHREIINIYNKLEYASMAPCGFVPALADKGIYIASESTFYRVFREKILNHRGRSAASKHNWPSKYSATVPNKECFVISIFFRIFMFEVLSIEKFIKKRVPNMQHPAQKNLFKTGTTYYRTVSIAFLQWFTNGKKQQYVQHCTVSAWHNTFKQQIHMLVMITHMRKAFLKL